MMVMLTQTPKKRGRPQYKPIYPHPLVFSVPNYHSLVTPVCPIQVLGHPSPHQADSRSAIRFSCPCCPGR